MFVVGLATAMSASAQTYSGSGLDDLINTMIGYEADGTGSSANYVAAAGLIPAYGALYTPNASVGGPNAAIWVGNELSPAGGNIPGTLSSLSADYTLLSSGIGPGRENFAPYWVLSYDGRSRLHLADRQHLWRTTEQFFRCPCGGLDPWVS